MSQMECASCGAAADCREMTGCRSCKKPLCRACARDMRGFCPSCGHPDMEAEYQNDGHEPPAF